MATLVRCGHKRPQPSTATSSQPSKKKKKKKYRSKTARDGGDIDSQEILPLLNEFERSRLADHTVQSASHQSQDLCISKFMLTADNLSNVTEANNQYFQYIVLRTASTPTTTSMCDLQSYLQRSTGITSVEQTAYSYLKVLDKNADSRETILEGLCVLHKELDIGISNKHLVVTHIQNLKHTYREKLKWVIPFPGDFHMLNNYQEVRCTFTGMQG